MTSASAPLIIEGLFSYQIGGSERVGATLAREFQDRGYRVICFAVYGSEGPIREELESAGIRCLHLDYTRRWRLTRRLTYQIELARVLRREGASALHLHHATSLVPCGLAAKLSGVRSVMTEHDLAELIKRPAYRAQAARFCRLADAVTVVHEGMEDFFREQVGVPSEKLHAVRNGIAIAADRSAGPTGIRARVRAELGISADAFAIMFAGRLSPVKDLGTLIRGYAGLASELRQRARLIIVGDGAERANLQELATALDLGGQVTFTGARSDVPRLLAGADAFAMTSVTEGLPMALLEAMAARVPCLATAVGGIPELFAGGAGCLVPASDPVAVSAGLARLMTDVPYRASLIRHGLELVTARHDLQSIVTRYLEILGLPPRWPPASREVAR